MELEKQVCSLELAKRLKESGVQQESAFFWSRINGALVQLLSERECQYELTEGDGVERYSAFTVAELGEMMPRQIETKPNRVGVFRSDKVGDSWRIAYCNDVYGFITEQMIATTEADARAKMLAYLLECELIPET